MASRLDGPVGGFAPSLDAHCSRRAFLRGTAVTLTAIALYPLAACDGAPASPDPNDVQNGRWTALVAGLGFAGLHAAVLPTGKVLYFSYDPERANHLEIGYWRIWDPSTGQFTTRDPQLMDRNLFCSGHSFLPDGRLLVSAGQSFNWFPFIGTGADHDVHTFDPNTESWDTYEKMPGARWYPTCVTLADGRALMAAGQANIAPWRANEDAEFFDWRDDTKSAPFKFNPGHLGGSHASYPFLKLLPDGSSDGVLLAHSHREARLFRPSTGTWEPDRFLIPGEDRTYPFQASCVMLPLSATHRGKVQVMIIGGLERREEVPPEDPFLTETLDYFATDRSDIFEFDPTRPAASAWREPGGGRMKNERFMGDGVILPDGTVLVANGARKGHATYSDEAVTTLEIFDPVGESWTQLDPEAPDGSPRKRLYHSTAVALPDGRVAVAGNTEAFNPANPMEDKTVEVFSPPYLYRGPRPAIMDASPDMGYAGAFRLRVDGPETASVALLKTSSTTHTNNTDQRYIRLPIVDADEGEIVVETPRDGTIAPPGHYWLFALSSDDVPSVGRSVQVT